MRQIVIEKSILRKRVVYKMTPSLVFDYTMMYFFSWLFPIMSIYIKSFTVRGYYDTPVGFLIIEWFINIWIITGLYFMNKLVVAEGVDFTKKKEVITRLLEEKYPDMAFTFDNPNLIRGIKTVGFSRERIISIILKDNYLYINILNTYRGTGFSFIHGLTNYIKSKNLAILFKNSVAAQTTY